ncbi:unnamed protein product [Ceutorhynchus assimilis]|uniref:Uncharacterized protein n=1 Tax=Ceutorhynchus assimilis TaxID=467358 RepID=A0A9N9QLI7_9CUCU|nr:unnamed protein product [Ceutorhynchus assimilis]
MEFPLAESDCGSFDNLKRVELDGVGAISESSAFGSCFYKRMSAVPELINIDARYSVSRSTIVGPVVLTLENMVVDIKGLLPVLRSPTCQL